MSTGRTIGLVVGISLLVGFVLIGSCGALVFKGYKSSDQEISPLVDEMMAGIERGDLGPTFYKLATTAEQKKMDQVQVTAAGDMMYQRLGKLESKSVEGFNLRVKNGVSTRTVNYQASFERDEGTIRVEAVKQAGEWRLQFFKVLSPALKVRYATCSACGKSHPNNAKFCPACGAQSNAPVNIPEPAPK